MAVEIQIAVEDFPAEVSDLTIQDWVSAVFDKTGLPEKDLTVRVTGIDEMQQLNSSYRKKQGPTNVLSFPFDAMPDQSFDYLGDIVICYDVVKSEAIQQHKSLVSHLSHMVVHGTLHLCGFDHQTDSEAEQMEAIEQALLVHFQLF